MIGWYVKQSVKQIASPLFDRAGIYEGRIDEALEGGASWLIVTYHRVVASRRVDPYRLGMCVSRKRFERQIEYFARNFEPIRLCDAVARVNAGRTLPDRAVSITFDDGYVDNLENAAGILEAWKMPWTLFVAVEPNAADALFWWDRVITAIGASRPEYIDCDALGIGSGKRSMGLFDRRNTVSGLLDLLWKLEPNELQAAVAKVEALFADCSVTPARAAAARMNDAQIRELAESGVEIGGHSLRHYNLTRLSDAELRDEITGCYRRVLELTGVKPAGFAYPGGHRNEAALSAVRAQGFEYAVSTARRLNSPSSDLYDLGRFSAPDAAVADVKRCLADFARDSAAS